MIGGWRGRVRQSWTRELLYWYLRERGWSSAVSYRQAWLWRAS